MKKIIFVSALLAVSGLAFAGKGGTPGGPGSGSGGVVSADSVTGALAGLSVLDTPPNPGLYERIRKMPGARMLDDKSVVSPPARLPNGDVVQITVDPSGKITNYVKL